MKKSDVLLLTNDFANRSFRDVADQDYIAARLSHRANLREPFLWSALQAMEKYFKAILLYNGLSAKKLGHDLNKALKRIEGISDIGLSIPSEARSFIDYLNVYGANRYLEFSTHLKPHALVELDRTVWHVRKYCFYMRTTTVRPNGTVFDWLPSTVKRINSKENEEYPHKYKIRRGFLEEAIRKDTVQAQYLIYHNFYYGRTKKRKIKNYKNYMSSTNPTLSLHPEVFDELDKVVQFSSEFRKYMKQHGAKTKP